jgi:protocatechuate 3,4-dioxygenase beta subunit
VNSRSYVLTGLVLLCLVAALWTFGRVGRIESLSPSAAPSAPPEVVESPSTQTLASPSRESESPVIRSSVEAPAGPANSTPPTPHVEEVVGKVVDDLGSAVQRFKIEAHRGADVSSIKRDNITGAVAAQRSFATANGSFEISSLSAGDWTLVARGSGAAKSEPVHVKVPLDGHRLVLVLPRPASVVGVVLSADELPVSEASIYLAYTGEIDPAPGIRESKPLSRTDARGVFRLDDVRPGSFHLLASHDQYCDSDSTEVTVAPASRADVTIHLHSGGRVTGVIDPLCGALSDREVALYSHRGLSGWRRTRSDEQGRFSIEHVVPQDYTIELKPVSDPLKNNKETGSNIRKHITVRENETTEVIFGEDRGSVHITGTVLCSGIPAPEMEVKAMPIDLGEDRHQIAKTGKNGRFELDVNGPGEYELVVSVESDSYATFRRTIEPNTPADFVLEVPGGTLSGKVLAPDGKPMKRVPVTILRANDEGADASATFRFRYRQTHTDENGAFEFKLLPEGTYTLRAPDGFRRDSPPPRIPCGETMIADLHVGSRPVDPLVVRLCAEGRIKCRVVDASGSPVSNAAIQVFDASGQGLSAHWEMASDGNGWVQVDSVAPGTYTVGAQKKGQRVTSSSIRVEEGKTAETTVTIP